MNMLALVAFATAITTGGPIATDPLGSATAALSVQWEDSSRAPEHYRFFRRRPSPDSTSVSWAVTRSREAGGRGETVIDFGTCPRLERQLTQLESLQIGTVTSPISAAFPPSVSNAVLYTVWGRNEAPDGHSQQVMVQALGGPVSAWAHDVRGSIAFCVGEAR